MKKYLNRLYKYFIRFDSIELIDFVEFGDLSQYTYDELKSLIVDKYPKISFKLSSKNENDSFLVTYETKKVIVSILYQNDGRFVSSTTREVSKSD